MLACILFGILEIVAGVWLLFLDDSTMAAGFSLLSSAILLFAFGAILGKLDTQIEKKDEQTQILKSIYIRLEELQNKKTNGE